MPPSAERSFDFGMAVEEPADSPVHAPRGERQEEKAHHEEGHLGHDRHQDADDTQDKEEDRQRDVPGTAPPAAWVGRRGGLRHRLRTL